MPQLITPFLWFNNQAEEAVNFYVSIFPNARMGKVARYDEAGAQVSGQPAGSVMTVEFELNGQQFIALNGGPLFQFTEAVSFVVTCDTQEEVDHYWTKLTEGGQEVQCGWLKDKFGLSWQVVPRQLNELTSGPDKARAGRVMKAMLSMKKLIISDLENA